MKYRTILFDFDGVLCRDRFYTHTLLPKYKNIVEWIQANIFGNTELAEKWMRGEVSSEQINKIVSEACVIEFNFLHQKFLESVRLMRLDENVKKLALELKSSGKKIGLVTNNMDVFSDILIKNHRLNELFDVIINSSDHGMLKKEHDGKLFDITLEQIGENIQNTVMIDDSRIVTELYKQKGGHSFLYSEFEELKSFL